MVLYLAPLFDTAVLFVLLLIPRRLRRLGVESSFQMSTYGTFSGSSKMTAAQHESKTLDATVVTDVGYEDGHKGDGVDGWLLPKLTYLRPDRLISPA